MYKLEVYKNWTLVMQLGISLIVPIGMFVILGIVLKDKFGIDIMLGLVIFGLIVGIRNVYVILRSQVEHMKETEKNVVSEAYLNHMKKYKK